MDNSESTKTRRNFFQAGLSASLSLIQQVAGRNGDSSDDETTDLNEDEEYIQKGVRGVIVFPVQSARTGKKKIMHLHLYKAQLIQYHESKKRVYPCNDIVNFVRTSEKQAQIELRGVMDMQTRTKKFNFETEAHAEKFHQYLEFLIELGKGVKQSWSQIDFTKKGKIIAEDLQAALARVDLPSDDATVEKMITYGTAGYDSVDYYGFFHMFMSSYVSNLRECLQEWLSRATATEKDSTGTGVHPSLKLLPGEIVTFAPNERLNWSVFGGKSCKQPFFVPGIMYMTNYRVVFISTRKQPPSHITHSRFDVPAFFNVISIPLANIYRHYCGPPRNSIFIICKDYRVVQLTLSGFLNNKSKVETFMQLLSGLAYYNATTNEAKEHFFAFKHHPNFIKVHHGWQFTDLVKEYVRQGIYDLKQWTVFENIDYSLSDTYPLHCVLPKKMTTEQICTAAAFRSRGRLPVITYLHAASKAVLARSAQPLVGITQKNCPEDELLLNLYRLKGLSAESTGSTTSSASAINVNHAKLYILDARGRIAANLNMAAGKGTEDVSAYFNAELIFGNIENIHVMRNAANSFAECLSPDIHPYTGMKEVLLSSEGSGSGYASKIEDSGWLRHVRLILVSSVFAAEKLHFDGNSVLVHCSDGWDRTAQICSVTQILLDPYFRTIEGIAVLIEKDWCAFGHKFQERTGIGMDQNVQADERSPVFLQFLDCLFQLLQQFPQSFEFNEHLLIFIANHVHSALFGNFLGNSEKERMQELQVQTHTVSIWAYVLNYQESFTNKSYQRFEAPIWPSVAIHKMKIWERYWMRWDMTSHPNNLDPEHHWVDDWGDLYL